MAAIAVAMAAMLRYVQNELLGVCGIKHWRLSRGDPARGAIPGLMTEAGTRGSKKGGNRRRMALGESMQAGRGHTLYQ